MFFEIVSEISNIQTIAVGSSIYEKSNACDGSLDRVDGAS